VARTPTTVTVATDLVPQPLTVVIPAGRSSVTLRVPFPKAGVAVLRATSPGMNTGAAFVAVLPVQQKAAVVHAPLAAPVVPVATAPALPGVHAHVIAVQPERPIAGVLAHHTVPMAAIEAAVHPAIPADPAAPAPTAVPAAPAVPAPAPPSPVTLRLDVLPGKVHPRQGTWQASLHVVTTDRDGTPATVLAAVPVRFAASKGTVAPAGVTIPAGQATNPDEVTLTALSPGQDTIQAWLPTSPPVTSTVEYERPEPRGLKLDANPARVVNSGKTPVHLTILLVDELGHPVTYPTKDVAVMLRTGLGEIRPNPVTIPRGQIGAEATLTSATSGIATITGLLEGFPNAVASTTFVFPSLLVALACIGGVTGAFVRELVHGQFRWRRAWRALVPGLILGIIFFALVLFGAVGSIPNAPLPIDISVIPSVNDLGALVLGFLGGYFGKRWLTPGSPAAEPATP